MACKGSAEVSFFACAAQQSLWHCMEACHALGRVRRASKRPMSRLLRRAERRVEVTTCEADETELEAKRFSPREAQNWAARL